MINRLLRHYIYSQIVEEASDLTGVQPHYKVRYQLSMLRPRWLILKWMRLRVDGHVCHQCGRHGSRGNGLQLHHPPGVGRNQPGLTCVLRELIGTIILCDECHHD